MNVLLFRNPASCQARVNTAFSHSTRESLSGRLDHWRWIVAAAPRQRAVFPPGVPRRPECRNLLMMKLPGLIDR